MSAELKKFASEQALRLATTQAEMRKSPTYRTKQANAVTQWIADNWGKLPGHLRAAIIGGSGGAVAGGLYGLHGAVTNPEAERDTWGDTLRGALAGGLVGGGGAVGLNALTGWFDPANRGAASATNNAVKLVGDKVSPDKLDAAMKDPAGFQQYGESRVKNFSQKLTSDNPADLAEVLSLREEFNKQAEPGVVSSFIAANKAPTAVGAAVGAGSYYRDKKPAIDDIFANIKARRETGGVRLDHLRAGIDTELAKSKSKPGSGVFSSVTPQEAEHLQAYRLAIENKNPNVAKSLQAARTLANKGVNSSWFGQGGKVDRWFHLRDPKQIETARGLRELVANNDYRGALRGIPGLPAAGQPALQLAESAFEPERLLGLPKLREIAPAANVSKIPIMPHEIRALGAGGLAAGATYGFNNWLLPSLLKTYTRGKW